jgi:hypothetical protein
MKSVLSLIAITMLMVSTSSVQASDGNISRPTLSALGLGGATVVSDSEALAVRGHGYAPSKSIAIAAGGSFAYVGAPHAGAGSVNVYFAAGKHFAGGVNYSEAGKTVTKTTTIGHGHHAVTVTHTKSIKVYAGGFSAAAAF